MKHNGKIGRLPEVIREQVNGRLEREETASSIAEWLNSLPEVRAMLEKDFGGVPISQQNVSEWSRGGFVESQMRRAAVEFAVGLKEENSALPNFEVGDFSEQLTQWIALRYGAMAHDLSLGDSDREKVLTHMRLFCREVLALRRGELSAGRLRVLERRLAIEEAVSEKEKEKEFWEWVKRPEIQAQLYPHRDPEKTRQDVERMLDEKFLGIRRREGGEIEETADPAILI
jgi:hypothetical protein